MIPVPAWLARKAGAKTATIIVDIFAGLLAVALVVGIYMGVKHYFVGGLETQVKVTAAQAGAQAESGHEAVQITTNVADNAAAADATTQENANVIDHAKGATDVVDPAARAAGLRALCSRKSYRDTHPACVQHAHP